MRIAVNEIIPGDNFPFSQIEIILMAIPRKVYRNGTLLSAVYCRSMRWAAIGKWAKCTLDPLSGRT